MAELSLTEIYWSSQQDYDTVKNDGFKPRSGLPPWPLRYPLDWAADPFSDNNWRFQLHAWRMTDPMLGSYEASGDSAYLREAFDVAADWWEFHRNGAADMSWNDMAAGIRALRLAYLVEKHAAGPLELTDAEAAVLGELAGAHLEFLSERSNVTLRSNHGLFQIFGLKRLGRVAPPVGADTSRLADDLFREALELQFTDEGVHKEHSPDYHFFTLRVLNQLGATDLFTSPELEAVVTRARELTPFLVGPDRRVVAVGDSAPSVQKPARPAEPAVSDCARSGYNVVQSGGSMLFMTGARYSFTHKHADELSFVLYERGRPVLIDSGKYGYQNDEWRRYFLDAAAHNTVTVDQTPISPRAKIGELALEPVRVEGGWYILRGVVDRTGLFRQERVIRYQPGAVLVVDDHLTAARPRTFVSSLHLAPDLVPELRGSALSATMDEDVTMHAAVAGGRLSAVRGGLDPIAGWESTGYLEKHPTTVVRATSTGTDVTVTWTVTFGLAEPPP